MVEFENSKRFRPSVALVGDGYGLQADAPVGVDVSRLILGDSQYSGASFRLEIQLYAMFVIPQLLGIDD